MSLVLVLCLLAGSVCVSGTKKSQAAVSTSTIYNNVKSAYGSSFPLSDSNKITTGRKNVFGQYSTILGVSAKLFSSYTAASKKNNSGEYNCFICKATSKKNVKKIKKALKKFVVQEYNSNINYFTDSGKAIMKKAKYGSKGKYVYLFVLDASGNSKAISAFKNSFS